MARCFLVIGTPRSGTSLTAGILSAMGIDMGPSLPANEWNPAGFFQDVDFIRLFMNFDFAQLQSLVAKRSRGTDWGVKSPDLALHFTEFVAACRDEIFIVRTNRAKERSIASWQARTNAPHQIDEYVAALEKLNPAALPTITVDFDSMIDSPLEQITRLAEFCGRQVTPEALALPNPALRRH